MTSTPHFLQVKPLEDVASMRHSWISHILLERYYGWELGGGGPRAREGQGGRGRGVGRASPRLG